ncbi:MAG: hypothetical protein CVU22_17040 [Betaproteobacteria bacterium HGW-Betaproteobacteria-16]|nr:MAG: hypothetical protein CVU22_17040 [Betaproteobacteria bacterium HGW-Betaproteobacteria-16]
MGVQFIRGEFLRDLLIAATWSDFWLFLGAGLALLFVSARLAKVRVGSFPANPLYWHYWVMANAHERPLMSDSLRYPKIHRPYVFAWAISLCSLLSALLVLATLLIVG